MIDPSTALDSCTALIEAAQRAGADGADAAAGASSSQSVTIRMGQLEDVERSESEEITLRAFVGRRSAAIRTSDFTPAAIAELAERAVAMARLAPEDPYAGLVDPETLFKGDPPDLDLADDYRASPETLRERAAEAEDAARAVAGVTNSEGGSAAAGRSLSALATSNGFAQAYVRTSHALSASVIAGEGGGMQRDYAYRSAHHRADLPSPAEVGRLAGGRAVARLGPGTVRSGPASVVFDRRVSPSLLGHLVGAMSGSAIARGASFLVGRLDEDLFPAGVRIVEDPHRMRGPASRPFDGEGVATVPRDLVADRRLSGWLCNLEAARQLGLQPTGHAARGGGGSPGIGTSNLWLEPGDSDPQALIADIERGVWVTELIGQGVNPVTGDYSRGASGFLIENGQLAGPVAEFTVAGNLSAMFAKMVPANDLERHRAVEAPSVRIDGMTLAGA